MLRNALRRTSNQQFGLVPKPRSFVCTFCQHTPSPRLFSTTFQPSGDGVASIGKDISEMMNPAKAKKKKVSQAKETDEKKETKRVRSRSRKSKKEEPKGGIIRRIQATPGPEIKPKTTSGSKSKSKPTSSSKSKSKAAQESIHAAMQPRGTNTIEHGEGLCMEGREIDPVPIVDQPPVATLSHGLDRVLFNPGVVYLQDPRSRVFNFDPYLEKIMPVTEFDFDAVGAYITSSKDTKLEKLMKEHGKKYMGSTSSMTSVLSHFHYLLSAWRPINIDNLSKCFDAEYTSFTQLSRLPTSIFLRYKGDGTYAIDSDKELDGENVLSFMGRSMEKALTLPPDMMEKFRLKNSHTLPDEIRNSPETYHYSTFEDFMMRSQLDAYDPRLPGTGMFDLKTRAVVSVRIDVSNFQLGSGYQIKSRTGNWESFEREYFDMIRAAFLKYSMQVRIGRMDGIFVAFHNTERIFGFQYISLAEMDAALHEGPGSGIGDQEFKLSLTLLNKMLDKAIAKYPNKSLRLHFETRETTVPYMYMFAEPMTEEEIETIQQGDRCSDQEFMEKCRRKLIEAQEAKEALNNPIKHRAAPIQSPTPAEALATATDPVAAIEEAEIESDITVESLDPEFLEELKKVDEKELYGLTLMTKNFVNKEPVLRPNFLAKEDRWDVEYSISEFPENKVWSVYNALRVRKHKHLENRMSGEDVGHYVRYIRQLAKEGRVWEKVMADKDADREKIVFETFSK